jgi:hypothetical protein
VDKEVIMAEEVAIEVGVVEVEGGVVEGEEGHDK